MENNVYFKRPQLDNIDILLRQEGNVDLKNCHDIGVPFNFEISTLNVKFAKCNLIQR